MTTSAGQASRKRVLLIGWESASFRVLRKLADSGQLPASEGLFDSGQFYALEPVVPRLRTALWASLITGCPPHRHGVLHSLGLVEDDRSLTPISSRECRLPTIARILSDAGLRVHQVGGAATSPAEPINGVWIGDRFPQLGDRGAVDTSGVLPWMTEEQLLQQLVDRFRSPADVQAMSLLQFLQEQVLRSSQAGTVENIFRPVLAESNTLFGVASLLIDDPGWDFFTVVFPSLGRLLRHRDVLAGCIEAADWARALSACYEQLDLMLGHLVRQAGPEALVLLVSADGSDGPFVVLNSKAVAAGLQPPDGARLIDIAPTISTVLCGAVPSWLEGRTWVTSALESDKAPAWEKPATVQAADAHTSQITPHQPVEQTDPSIVHLLELGYDDLLRKQEAEARQVVDRETGENLVTSLLDDGLFDQGIAELNSLCERFPEVAPLRELRAEVNARIGDVDEAGEDLRHLTENGQESARLYLVRGLLALRRRCAREAVDFLQIAEHLQPSLQGLHAAQGEALQRIGHYAAAGATYDRGLDRYPRDPALMDGRVVCLIARGALEEAAEAALDALAIRPKNWKLHYHLARALILLGHAAEAEAALETSLRLHPDNAAACYWLATLAEQSSRPSEAVGFRARGLEILRQRRASPAKASASEAS